MFFGSSPFCRILSQVRSRFALLNKDNSYLYLIMAEREGFEPSVRSPVQLLSREPQSTTLAPLRIEREYIEYLIIYVIPIGLFVIIAGFIFAPVAQLDRVLGYEPSGREFESLRARQYKNAPLWRGILILI